ncbi:hypothetical protein GQ55_1G388600 [Panicum hallii var. hallii]|uniref:Uncharacterized protein n=1 Tax=Panicum hallii var. hallii TaxID=1504633 RepID=A0A2T7FC25_9POAL|nr:hypothetical protein GQ55_1G388600 [Panicum hallii var. hallii]
MNPRVATCDPFLFSSLGEKNSYVFFLEGRGMVRRGEEGVAPRAFRSAKIFGVVSVDDQRRLSASSLLGCALSSCWLLNDRGRSISS